MNFTDKVVLITGASSGIGYATAILFAKLGAKLSLTGRNVKNLQKVAGECKSVSQNDPLLITADLSNESDVAKVVNSTIEKYKKIDILINNAGLLESGGIENTDVNQYDRIFNVNVRAVYQLTNLAVPYLVETKGNIVNVSSVAGLRSFPSALSYCMSKAALDQFTRCIALELAGKGVRVNSVNPGVIVTDIHKRAGMSESEYEAYLVKCKETHAVGRVGTPDEVANGIAFLASDLASFSTGVTLEIDGGKHAMCPR